MSKRAAAMELRMNFILSNNPDYMRGNTFDNNYADWLAPIRTSPILISPPPTWQLSYGDALDGKVIIDITNPISPDLTGMVTPAGSSGAQQIAKGAIAADDSDAKARVSTFIARLGLRPLEALGLLLIGVAKNGAGTWDIALNIDIG